MELRAAPHRRGIAPRSLAEIAHGYLPFLRDKGTTCNVLPENQGHILAFTVSFVPYSLENGTPGMTLTKPVPERSIKSLDLYLRVELRATPHRRGLARMSAMMSAMISAMWGTTKSPSKR